MGQVLRSQAIKVVSGAANRSAGSAPTGTARAQIASPVNCYAQVSASDQTPFRPSLSFTFDNQPTAGQIWQSGALPGTAYTWVTGTPVGNQIKIGADIAATISNLIAVLVAQGWNVIYTGGTTVTIEPPVYGQGSDEAWGYQGQTYLMIDSGPVIGTGGAGFYVPAGKPVEVPAVAGQNVWLWGAPGVTTSDPAFGNGASVAWLS